MSTLTSNEIQEISSEFRQVACRLSKTDCHQCDANLLRFLAFIEKTPLIIDFINENNKTKFDIGKICNERDWLDPFSISPDKSEEIAFEYQMLIHAKTEYKGDFTSLYGTFYYTCADTTAENEIRTFIKHIIDPFIDHISEYLQSCYRKALRLEDVNQKSALPYLRVDNSTVLVGSTMQGTINNNMAINSQNNSEIATIIKQIRDLLNESGDEKKDEVLEVLEVIENSVTKSEKPKKGFLTTLQTLAQLIPSIIPLVSLLITQLSK